MSFTTRDVEKLREQARLVRAEVDRTEAAKKVIRTEIKEREKELKKTTETSPRREILKEEIDKLRETLYANKPWSYGGGGKTRRRRKTRKTRKTRKINKFRI